MSWKNKKPLKKKAEGNSCDNKTIYALQMISPSAKRKEKQSNRIRSNTSNSVGTGRDSYNNRRKYDRPSMLACLELTLDEGYCLEGYAVNVSYGGIGLYTQKAILAGTEIQIKIPFVDGTGEELFEINSGTVLWCRPVGQWYGMGIKFKCVDPVEHSMLIGYLEMAKHVKENTER